MNETYIQTINAAFETILELSPSKCPKDIKEAVHHGIEMLDSGNLRSAIPLDTPHQWKVIETAKKAILLYFKISDNHVMNADGSLACATDTSLHAHWFYDKIPLKTTCWAVEDFQNAGFRMVPGAIVRKGSFIGEKVILMTSFVNIGAYVGNGTMVDTWATVGSCAQIGKNCHLSGGVGIGGVLEPLQSAPTIIEDNCFIGARSEIVEGVVVEEGSVIGMGCFIGQSTPIYDREKDVILDCGRIPAGSVVIPTMLTTTKSSRIAYAKPAVMIVKRVDAQTRAKTATNELLRDAYNITSTSR